ncbi:RagB/SusD family nutrient uptake outer membrane protein [Hymenobacter sp. BT664]|uniref:RagB/SusD family nutrient uptake outer membrane protein n=1 Tax=Hymenobacter montanus TaxID=2771359 RepID=A0A927BDQ9_9BACT|nr:RagB/SusD family nutrient uptake outer membrane protein [Hymenobacter montanus]MBD2768224.1 RagB/SusD family nutrient uptake outer membrane protein [Hymenobacter montanus]
MQNSANIKPRTLLLAGVVSVLIGASGCNPTTIDPVTDPNNPSLESVITNATPTQINALANGVEASLRLGHTNNAPYNQITGTLGREIIILASNEPRWYTEILGSKTSLDNGAFYSTGSYNTFARTIRAANVLRQSLAATSTVTPVQKQGLLGFCDTYEAIAKLHMLNLMGENGIRIDVADFLKPGKFTVGSAPALANIRQLLDLGATELGQAGTDFSFPLSNGYAGFDTPASFLRFNRAIAARVALYQGDNAGALTALSASFYSPTASLTLGPKITFRPGTAGDQGNSYFQVPNSGPSTLVTVPDNFVSEAETGDQRLSKVSLRTTPRTAGGITGRYDPTVYATQNAPVAIIRNEELILIAAEAKAKTNDITGAVQDINTIRTRSGNLPPYAGATTQAALLNEILRQRRYSLFYEGHFWVDLRRLGKLNPNPTPNITLPYSTGTFRLFDRLAIPFAEVAWDQANP